MKNSVKMVLTAMIVASAGLVHAAEFPLRVDIDVSTKRDSRMLGAGNQGEAKVDHVQVLVKIRKDGGQPYTDPLTAELYVIGKQIQTGYLGIIDVVKKGFTFSKDNDNTFKFSSKDYALGHTGGNITVGGVYETYLLVVVDKDGKEIATRSGRVIKPRGIEFIRELGPETLFDRDGNVVGKIDQAGRAFQRAVPAAVISTDDY